MAKVLITERGAGNADLFAEALRSAGYEVETATSGEEGLILYNVFDPHIVTTAMRLNYDEVGNPRPGRMDGFQYAMQLRDNGFTGPIVALTGGAAEFSEYASLHGVPGQDIPTYITKVLQKPLGPQELIDGIQSL